ncbi:hypothetical protein [Streptomyces abikoensis]|uniref:Uncharacterized protein n=1 Tax=Streptomyces abikoensis TaxID=97398 RepID=A0ABW7TCU9_9ACTN
MSAPTPCPGTHNNAWRRAENELADHGTPHDLSPVYGNPLHCPRCSGRAHSELKELPELVVAVWLESLHGSQGPKSGTIGRSPTAPRWPGESSRLLTDRIIGGLLELEDDIRDLRRLAPRRDSSEGAALTAAVRLIEVHLDWALTEHPAAGEVHDRLSANPAAQIHAWHTAATRFTRRDDRPEHYRIPCPRCELLTLFRDGGDAYIECRNIACGLLLTPEEYHAHTVVLADRHRTKMAA